jgi:3'-5' exoribonuclease
MSRAKPSLARLSDLTPGQYADFFALLQSRTKNTTRDGKPYYQCRFGDAKRTATAMIWQDSPLFDACERDWREGEFYKVRGVYQQHDKYGSQIEIHNIRPVLVEDRKEGFDPGDFVERTRFDVDGMFAELQNLVREHVADPALQRLVLTLLDQHADRLKTLPATTRHAYPFYGGLLEHVLSATRTSLFLVEHYRRHYPDLRPPINKDLIVAAAALHEMGRVLEFADTPGKATRTIPGKLVGPILLGRDLVRETAKELGDVDPHLLPLLEHVLVAHVNLLEKDSPRQPMIPECLIVHHADALDSYMEMFIRRLTRDNQDGPFTEHDPVLNRQLLKERDV